MSACPRASLVMLAMVSGACAPRVPLEVTCVAAELQQAACSFKTIPDARLSARTESGAIELTPVEMDPDGTTRRLNLLDVPLEAKTVTFEAADRTNKHRPGTATWRIAFPVRYRLTLSVAADGLASIYFTVPPGDKVTFDGRDLAVTGGGGAEAKFDLAGDLPIAAIENYDGSHIPFVVTDPSGASAQESLRAAAPDVLVRDLKDALRHKAQPLPFAAPVQKNAGPRPLVYLHGDAFLPKNGLVHLRELELVAVDDDSSSTGGDEEIDLCEGMYTAGSDMAVVTRWRYTRTVEVYEARTGALRAKKTFRGSMPRECRQSENVLTINGHATSGTIMGGPVDEAAVDAWLATQSANDR